MASSSRLSEASQAERTFKLSVEQFEQDTFLPDARDAFAERAAEAYGSGLDKNEELLIRDSTTNPRVLEYRVNQSLENLRLYKFRYKETLAKQAFLEMLRDNVKVTHEDNERLRNQNLAIKAQLKTTKRELNEEYDRIAELSAHVGGRAESVKAQLDEGAQLVQKMQEMRWELSMLRSSQAPEKRLTIEQLIERLADQDDQLIAHTEAETRLSEQLARLRTAIAEITARLDKLAVDRPRAAAQASALHQMDLNERAEITKLCTMRRDMIALYQKIMRIQAPIAASENELRIPFEIDPYSTGGGDAKRTVVLSLVFNPANRRLAGAQLIGSDVDIEELLLVAKETNDVPGFIRDVRHRVTSALAAT